VNHTFGSDFTVGIEEELHLVDPATHRLVPDAARLLAAMDLPEESAGHEAYAAQVELRSAPRASAAEAVADLADVRRAARVAGGTLVGAGLHPADEWGDTPLVDTPRYVEVGESMRSLIRRSPEAGLHVHVGMPDPETAIRAFNGLRRHLPLLIGLCANSPWWFGGDSGLASARWALVRSYPGRGIPPTFDDWAGYLAHLDRLAAAGGPPDYTFVWWDIRLHPRLGTVEVRELDAQSSLEDVAAVAELVQALARREADAPAADMPPAEAIGWSCFRAARDGLGAEILHEGRLMPLREAAAAVGGEAIERLLARGGGADRRRAAFARGGIDAMLADLVAETAG
jgi:carboxylate-amine ligase